MVPQKSNDFSVEGNLVEDPCHVVTGNDRNLVVFRLVENNRRINRLRSVVEHTIAQVKTWRMLPSGAGADFLCN